MLIFVADLFPWWQALGFCALLLLYVVWYVTTSILLGDENHFLTKKNNFCCWKNVKLNMLQEYEDTTVTIQFNWKWFYFEIFFMFGPPKESIFLTTFYGLYFQSSFHIYFTDCISSMFTVVSSPIYSNTINKHRFKIFTNFSHMISSE